MLSKKSPRATQLEPLESRQLLSASLLGELQNIVVTPASQSATAAAVNGIDGYTPAQIRKAYGFDKIRLANGITGDGAGQTIAIVTAYNDPKIASDVHTFDAAMGINDNFSLSVVGQNGGKVSSLATDAGWAGETALDVEWAHAIAPKAKILLVEANTASLGNLLTAVDFARHAAGVSVVSMSWGADEFWSETSFDKYFTTPAGHQGVTFVAASGDNGSWWGPSWPSSSSNVLAVGGTSLNINSAGGIGSETGWGGSGGGISSFESQPTYQLNAQHTGGRTNPDVSYNADPNTGFAFFNSVDDGSGFVGWQVVGGTSAGAPQWSALVAIANQGRAAAGKSSLDGSTGTLPMLYALYNNPTAYAAAFNDVTVGRSSFFLGAHTGYDGVSGLGSPKAAGVIGALVGPVSAAKTATTTASTTTTTTASRTAGAQLARKAAAAEQTVTVATTTVFEVSPARGAVAANRLAAALFVDAAAGQGVGAGHSSSESSVATTTFGGGLDAGDSRASIFSGRRVSAVFGAGYEAARPASVNVGRAQPGQPMEVGAAPAAAEPQVTGPWVLSGIVPIDAATATRGTGGYGGGGALATRPATATAAMVPDVGAVGGGFRHPRAVALALVAATAEVFVLSYRRLRRKRQGAAATAVVEPIAEPLVRRDR
jgi:hypothetical protein